MVMLLPKAEFGATLTLCFVCTDGIPERDMSCRPAESEGCLAFVMKHRGVGTPLCEDWWQEEAKILCCVLQGERIYVEKCSGTFISAV